MADHTDELTTARLGAGADLVYLIDAARQHLEAAEEQAEAEEQWKANVECCDLARQTLESAKLGPASELELAQAESNEAEAARRESAKRLRAKRTQADAMRRLHRQELTRFLARRPGPAEAEAVRKLAEL